MVFLWFSYGFEKSFEKRTSWQSDMPLLQAGQVPPTPKMARDAARMNARKLIGSWWKSYSIINEWCKSMGKNKLFNQALPVSWICLAKMTTFRKKGFISPNLRLQEMKLFIDCPIRRSPHVFQVQLKGSPEGSPAPASWSHAWRRQHTFKWPTGKPTTFPPPQDYNYSWKGLGEVYSGWSCPCEHLPAPPELSFDSFCEPMQRDHFGSKDPCTFHDETNWWQQLNLIPMGLSENWATQFDRKYPWDDPF